MRDPMRGPQPSALREAVVFGENMAEISWLEKTGEERS